KHLTTGVLRALVRCAKIRSYQHIGCSRRRGPLETAAGGGSVWPTIVGSFGSASDLLSSCSDWHPPSLLRKQRRRSAGGWRPASAARRCLARSPPFPRRARARAPSRTRDTSA